MISKEAAGGKPSFTCIFCNNKTRKDVELLHSSVCAALGVAALSLSLHFTDKHQQEVTDDLT